MYRNYILILASLFTSLCAARDNAAPLVSGDLLKAANLAQVWQTKLAVKPDENVDSIYLLGDRICAITSTNYMFCLDANSGNLAFGMQLASKHFPILAPQRYENQIMITAANKLIEVGSSGGALTSTHDFGYTVTSPVVRNNTNLYAAAIDRRIHAVSIRDKTFLFDAGADDGSMPTSVLTRNGLVVFATDSGNIISMQADKKQLRWQYKALDKITAPLVWDNNDLYAASWDTRLYKLNTVTGKPVWTYQLGGILKDSPQITDTIVYQFAPNKGITAIDKQSGKPLWTAEDGIDLLAEINGKAYIMTGDQTAGVFDNTTGKRLFTINFTQACLWAPNTDAPRIYVADQCGKVACIGAAK